LGSQESITATLCGFKANWEERQRRPQLMHSCISGTGEEGGFAKISGRHDREF